MLSKPSVSKYSQRSRSVDQGRIWSVTMPKYSRSAMVFTRSGPVLMRTSDRRDSGLLERNANLLMQAIDLWLQFAGECGKIRSGRGGGQTVEVAELDQRPANRVLRELRIGDSTARLQSLEPRMVMG